MLTATTIHHIVKPLARVITAGVVAAFIAASIWIFGHRQFGGFDHSALIDTGWRLFLGQAPYRDFVLTTPPFFYFGAWLALKLWGVKWSAFVLITVVYSVVTFSIHVMLLKQLIGTPLDILLAATCQFLTLVVTSYWWYNAVTSIFACLFITAAFVLARDPKNRWNQISFCFCVAILLLMKPNVAGSMIILACSSLFLRKEYRIVTLGLTLAGAALTLIGLLVFGINPADLLNSYLGLSLSRGLPSLHRFVADRVEEFFVSIPLILLCILLFAPAVDYIRQIGRRCWQSKDCVLFGLGFTGIIVGVVGLLTNQDTSFGDISLIFMGSVLPPLVWVKEGKIPDKVQKPWAFSTIMGCVALCAGLIFLSFAYFTGAERFSTGNPFLFFLFALWVECIITGMVIVTRSLLSKPVLPYFHSQPLRESKLAQIMGSITPSRLKVWVCAVAVICGSVAFSVGAIRWRVKYIGPGVFFTRAPLIQMTHPLFFENFYVSQRTVAVAQQINSALEAEFGPSTNWRNSSVFFGPRIVWGYAAYNIQSPKNLPIWWHPDNSFRAVDLQLMIERFFAAHFKICIFLIDPISHQLDSTFIPAVITQELERSYERIDYADIVVYVRQ